MKIAEVKGYGKINLFLDITGKRSDNYHNLNNVMQRIGIYDNLKISVSDGDGISVSCDKPEIPTDRKNIAFKAAEAYLREAGISAKVNIEIKKNIPIMAGLGGSSADGAAVLEGLNGIFGAFDKSELERLGGDLGADIPFCLKGGTALCQGIGEKMTDLDNFHRFIVIVQPDFFCETALGYKLYDEKKINAKGNLNGFLDVLKNNKAEKALFNIFEEIYSDERIISIKRTLLEKGAEGVCLSGSGSAVYGIFRDKASAERAAENLNFPFVRASETM